jgi:hypothetical protein
LAADPARAMAGVVRQAKVAANPKRSAARWSVAGPVTEALMPNSPSREAMSWCHASPTRKGTWGGAIQPGGDIPHQRRILNQPSRNRDQGLNLRVVVDERPIVGVLVDMHERQARHRTGTFQGRRHQPPDLVF